MSKRCVLWCDGILVILQGRKKVGKYDTFENNKYAQRLFRQL